MRASVLSAAALAAVMTVPANAAVGTPGPFPGVLDHGQTRTHHYDNNPGGGSCIDLAVPYTVTLTYAPPTDTVSLGSGATAVHGVNGRASVSFWAGYCAAFPIEVTGTSVANKAAYVVSVSSGPALSDH